MNSASLTVNGTWGFGIYRASLTNVGCGYSAHLCRPATAIAARINNIWMDVDEGSDKSLDDTSSLAF